MKRTALCLSALLLLCLLGGCGPSAPVQAAAPSAQPASSLERHSVVFMDTFDTVISLIGFAESEEAFNRQAAVAHQLFVDLHKRFDCYNSYEDEGIISVCTVNQRAAEGPVKVDPILFALLSFSKNQYESAKGQTNIAMGAVLSLWHDAREAGLENPEKAALPDPGALRAAAEHTDIRDLVLDPENSTVFFADPLLRLDVGAVAKGYAAEIVAKALLSGGMPSFIISAGGNVRIGLPPEDGRANWGIGIQDPDGAVLGTNDIVETLYLHGCSVVTSGDYQRFYTVDGRNYCHLIDPDTLYPGEFYRSVSIITEDSGYADLLSTAAYLMPYEESRAFVEGLEGVEALWVFPDGHTEMTEGIRASAKSQGAVN